MWDEITYLFPNFNGAIIEVDKEFHPTFYSNCLSTHAEIEVKSG